jgi:hypothetical protein
MITMPTHIRGERVVTVFPIIGGINGFVEADVVTTNGDENQPATSFTVSRVKPSGEVLYVHEVFTSFPAAIRLARKNAGWG